MVAQHLPHCKVAAACIFLADRIAIAVRVAICSERSGEEEIAAAPAVFVARCHFVGEKDVVFIAVVAECAVGIASMTVAARVCTSSGGKEE